VLKVSATATIEAAPFADPRDRFRSLRLETVVATSDGLAYAVDTVVAGEILVILSIARRRNDSAAAGLRRSLANT
jgi:hypothetical protein